jgi:hypothetical protein
VAKSLKVAKSSAAGWLSELADAGAVLVSEAGRGRTATKWKVSGQSPDAGEDLLPTVESIFPEFAGHVDAKQIR